jgi:chromosomal replication initiation ATPase DnaA
MKMEALQLYEQITNERNVIYELVGQTGSGKTTLAIQIGDLFTINGKKVVFYQRKNEITIADVVSHMLIDSYKDETDLSKTDLVIIDDFQNPTDEMLFKLGTIAVRMGFKVLLLRQPTLQNKDEVEVKRIGKKIIVTKKETENK